MRPPAGGADVASSVEGEFLGFGEDPGDSQGHVLDAVNDHASGYPVVAVASVDERLAVLDRGCERLLRCRRVRVRSQCASRSSTEHLLGKRRRCCGPNCGNVRVRRAPRSLQKADEGAGDQKWAER